MPTLSTSKKSNWIKKRDQFGRRKVNNYSFYNSLTWRKHREIFIQNNPLCVGCDKKGEVKAANVVDHILPINQGGERFDYSNLQSLCHCCHNKKSGREAHQRG